MPIGARKCGQQTVICSSPSVNKTPIGNSTPPIPYPVQCTLSSSNTVSTNVMFNGNEAFTMSSDTNYVVGDAAGSVGGTSSGTTSKEAEPIEHSKTVMVNKKQVIRCGDKFDMNAKNTKGTLTCSPPSDAPNITDDGKVESEDPPPIKEIEEEKGFFDTFWDKAEDSWESAKKFTEEVVEKAEEINEEYKITTRLDGLSDVVFGAVEGVGATLLLIAPEPTMITKVGAGVLGVASIDNIQSGARQIWTGEATDSFIAEGTEAVATVVGANTNTVAIVKDIAQVAQNPKKILTEFDDIIKDGKNILKKPDNKKDNDKNEDKKNNVAVKGECKRKKGGK